MQEDRLFKTISYLNTLACTCLGLIACFVILLLLPQQDQTTPPEVARDLPKEADAKVEADLWQPPDSTQIENTPQGDLIRYGRELVAHTALYLGPKGKLMTISNGMNCQNCHLKAGKKPFGNSYAAVAANYPKKRARSGQVESIERRVNDCVERSLNGVKLDEKSREMTAFVAYIKWVGSGVEQGVTPKGTGLLSLPVMDRPADSVKGRMVFEMHCTRCHGEKGKGLREGDNAEWRYPPLSHEDSYNIGAGLYRLSRFAAYVKSNMPYGVSYDNPTLTDEEAWDVAAYVNSLPRPGKDLSQDWPEISSKPFDHPFGPYDDNFKEQQHKYGPFGPIINAKDKKN